MSTNITGPDNSPSTDTDETAAESAAPLTSETPDDAVAAAEETDAQATPEPVEAVAEDTGESLPEAEADDAEATPEPVEAVAEDSGDSVPEAAANEAEATPEPVEAAAEDTGETVPEAAADEAEAKSEPVEVAAEETGDSAPVAAANEAEAKPEAVEAKAEEVTPPAAPMSASEQRFREAKSQHEVLDGRIIGWNKGGLHVVINDITAFCPRSEIELGEPQDPSTYVDQTLQFKVLKIQDKGRRIVVSRTAVLRTARSRNIRKLKKKLEVGSVHQGVVNSLTDFGAFIDLGGLQGLLHVSEISFEQVRSPADVLEVGQEVEVKVIKLESGGKRISLSMKALKPDPWKGVADRFKEGDMVTGTVERTTRFGVFVQLEPGLTGLLPMSEMNLPREASPARVFPTGKELKVQVVSVDRRRRRISLGSEGSKTEGSRADFKSYMSDQEKGGFHPFAAALKNLR